MYIMIIGCGRVGSSLANILQAENHNVVIIDKEPGSFSNLGPNFNGLTVAGNGFDIEVLKEAGAEKADAFCVVTNNDNINVMTAQIANKIFKVPKVIARVDDPNKARIYKRLGLNIISGTTLLAAMIRDKIVESHFTSYLIETGELGVIELSPSKNTIGKKVQALNLPDEFMIVTIIRKKHIIIPKADTILEDDDILLGIVRTESVAKIKKQFEMGEK